MKPTLLVLLVLLLAESTEAQQEKNAARNINDLAPDLVIPEVTEGVPAPGKRVRQWNDGFIGSGVYHVLYLPEDWEPGQRYPLIVEYPGNGGFQNALGDRSDGTVEGCKLGYGISGGRGMIWLCLPFVDSKTKTHQKNWWGDPDATVDYCVQTVRRICREYGGDSDAVVLTGFSRGAIACHYIGLRNDRIAALWRVIIPHSHYDGVRRWPYADSDTESARRRLLRLRGRPEFITHESSVADVSTWLKAQNIDGAFTIEPLPYPNHTAEWILRDIPLRAKLRAWLTGQLKKSN